MDKRDHSETLFQKKLNHHDAGSMDLTMISPY